MDPKKLSAQYVLATRTLLLTQPIRAFSKNQATSVAKHEHPFGHESESIDQSTVLYGPP